MEKIKNKIKNKIKIKNKVKEKLLVVIFGFLIAANNIFSQTGSVAGKITDTNNEAVAGADIILTGTIHDAVSDDSGYFKIPDLRNGNYQLSISIIGYQNYNANITINNNDIVLNIVLKEKVIQSEQIVVTAGKYKQQISELPVSASLMTSDEISRKNFAALDYAIRYAPGVNMNLDQVSIRGSSGYSRGAGTRVLVAMDGIPLYTGDTGEISWEIIPVTEIDRIEIIKGAASSLYGSSAIGGVINVITKAIPNRPFTYFKTYAGAYDKPAYSEWDWSGQYRLFNGQTLTHSNRIDKFSFTISGTRTENESFRQSDFLKRYTGYFKGAYQFNPASSLTLLANGITQNHGNFIYWKDSRHILQPPDADQGQRVYSDRYMFGAIYKNIVNNDFLINFKANYYNTHWRDESENQDDSRTQLIRGEVQATNSITNNLLLVSGIEAGAGKIKSNLFQNPSSFNIGAYAQGDYHFSFPLLVSLGMRFDYSKLDTLKSSNSFSPKIGFNYKVNPELILRASAGKGFRAPTLAEAFTKTVASGIPIKPNPFLKPEHNYSFELGFNKSFYNFIILDAAFFQNEYYDFIEPGVDPNDGQIYFDNVVRARIQGTEISATLAVIPDILRVESNYVYLWARDIDKQKPLKYRPRNSVTIKTDYTPGIFDFGADFRYWSRIEELDTELVDLGIVQDGENRVPVYVLDFRAGVNFNFNNIPVKLNLNLNNALNYNYIEIIGNAAPIRNVSLSAEFIL